MQNAQNTFTQESPSKFLKIIKNCENIINTPQEYTFSKKIELEAYLNILCSRKTNNLSILPFGRTKCLLCEKNFKPNEKLFSFPCGCMYIFHTSCFETNSEKYLRKRSTGSLQCKKCKAELQKEKSI